MIRRILMSLLVGGAIVTLDERAERAADAREAAGEMAERARAAADLCARVPLLCREVAERALGSGLPQRSVNDYVDGDPKLVDKP